MSLEGITRPLVLYHAPCRDGWAAAFLAKLRWPDAELVPQQYGDPVASDGEGRFVLRVDGEQKLVDFTDRDVLVLDFSYKREILQEMRSVVVTDVPRTFLVLDHHKTAKEDLAGLDYAVFDETRSGCGLALDYFFPGWRGWDGMGPVPDRMTEMKTVDPITMLHVAELCEAWDLWQHDRYDDVKEICAYLDTLPRTVEDWTKALQDDGEMETLYGFYLRGQSILAYQMQQVERIAKHAHPVTWPFGIGNMERILVNAVNSPVLQSEVGEFLYERDPSRASLVWYRNERMETVCSLRSKKGSNVNVEEMARKFGGGGHYNAAGFKIQPSEHENAAWLWHAADRVETKA